MIQRSIVPEEYNINEEHITPVQNERLPETISTLDLYKYFNIIQNPHDEYYATSLTQRLVENELLIFAPKHSLPAYKQVDRETFHFVLNPSDSMSSIDGFLDRNDDMSAKSSSSGVNVVNFYLDIGDFDLFFIPPNLRSSDNLVHIGIYYIDMNSLYICDLTHCRTGVSILKEIINYLKGKDYLHKYVVNKDNNKKKNPIRVTLGCDPEFEYVTKEGVVTENMPRKVLFGGKELNGREEIGLDGSGVVLEIRPEPCKYPKSLVNNIKNIFEKIKQCKLSVVGNKYAVGCHIHFGVGHEYYPKDGLIILLDDFLGCPCFRLNGTARGEYSELSQWRAQPHGFEYRSLPAAVMADPEFFRIVLKICKVIFAKYVNGITFKYELEDYDGFPTKNSYMKICGLSNKEYLYFKDYIGKFTNSSEVKKLAKNVIACWIEGEDIGVGFPAPNINARMDDYLDEEDSVDEERPCLSSGTTETVFFETASGLVRVNYIERWNEYIRDVLSRMLFNALNGLDESTFANFLCLNSNTIIRLHNSHNIEDTDSIVYFGLEDGRGVFRSESYVIDKISSMPLSTISINLIGLREDRGAIVSGFDLIDNASSHHREDCLGADCFGFPAWYRRQGERSRDIDTRASSLVISRSAVRAITDRVEYVRNFRSVPHVLPDGQDDVQLRTRIGTPRSYTDRPYTNWITEPIVIDSGITILTETPEAPTVTRLHNELESRLFVGFDEIMSRITSNNNTDDNTEGE